MRDQVLSGFGAMSAGDPDEVVEAILNAARDAGAPFRHFVGEDGTVWGRGSLEARLQAAGA
ncbi:MAG: hypothetical protein ACK5PT_03550 [Cereibacter sp.]